MKQSRFFRNNTTRHTITALAGLTLAAAPAALAQANTGQLTGTITDSAGALIPGAEIQLSNDENGQSRTANTDGSGNYTVQSLPVGTYTETINSPGFSSFKAKVTINVGGHATVDV